MDIVEFREYVLSLPAVEESSPFGDDVLVYKVGGKMFACVTLPLFERIAMKCDPELAIELRDRYEAITPAWHFNKKHWNDVYVNKGLADSFIREQIEASYLLVFHNSVTKKEREKILTKADVGSALK